MAGWPAVFMIAVVEIAIFIALNWGVFRRWWYSPLIIAIALVLFRPIDTAFTGDVSRVLPASLFSGGSDGKDQIIIASVVSAIMVPLVVASVPVCILRALWSGRMS